MQVLKRKTCFQKIKDFSKTRTKKKDFSRFLRSPKTRCRDKRTATQNSFSQNTRDSRTKPPRPPFLLAIQNCQPTQGKHVSKTMTKSPHAGEEGVSPTLLPATRWLLPSAKWATFGGARPLRHPLTTPRVKTTLKPGLLEGRLWIPPRTRARSLSCSPRSSYAYSARSLPSPTGSSHE